MAAAGTVNSSDPSDDALLRFATEVSSALDQVNGISAGREKGAGGVTGGESVTGQAKSASARPSDGEVSAVQPDSAASSSPSTNFATPLSNHSPEMKVTSLDADVARQNSSASKSSQTKRPPIVTRPRSGSGFSMLARLTSRGSSSNVHRSSQSTDSAMTNTADPSKSPIKPKLDKAALTRQTSKYKSGVNWENPDFSIARSEEPYAATSSPVEERTKDNYREHQEEAVLRELASAGGTKALLARAHDAGSIGKPYFPAAQRAAMGVSAQAQAHRSLPQSRAPGGVDAVRAGSTTPRTSPMINGNAFATPGDGAAMTGNGSAQSPKITSEQAQQILQSARDAVAMSNAPVSRQTSPSAAAGKDATAKGTNIPSPNEAAARPELMTSKSKKRMSFMGFGSNGNSKGNDGGKGTRKGKKGKAATLDAIDSALKEQAQPTTYSGGASSTKSASPDGTTTPGGTASRRRFRDTRELGLVASQLAAEALMPPSMAQAHYADTSTTALIAPSPAFIAEGRGSNASSIHASPLGGSPRMGSVSEHSSRYEAPRAAFASRKSPTESPTSAFATQSANINGLPSDMLTGLSDGPYPSLPPRAMDFVDPFSTTGSMLETGASSVRSGASSGRNSLPNVGSNDRRSRGMSSGSTQTWAGQTSGPRRSVMQMSMHNPEQELQGLTKVPKSGRSTPFGSRAPSRQVTPRSSVTNLREVGKDGANSPVPLPGVDLAAATDSKGKTKNRLSIFKKNRSTTELVPAQLHPPMPEGASSNVNRISTQSKISTSNDSVASNRNSGRNTQTNAEGDQTSLSNPSANSLVKVPSPSMTNTSGSSHDRSAHASSSDGDNTTQNATSAMTTPEIAPSKLGLINPSSTALPAPRTTAAPMTAISAPAKADLAAPMNAASRRPAAVTATEAKGQTRPVGAAVSSPPPSPIPPQQQQQQTPAPPISQLPSSQQTHGKLGKLTSRFATKSSTNLHELTKSSSKAGRGEAGYASKSQTHLPAFMRRDGNASSPVAANTPPTPRKFDTFRASLKRDWFV